MRYIVFLILFKLIVVRKLKSQLQSLYKGCYGRSRSAEKFIRLIELIQNEILTGNQESPHRFGNNVSCIIACVGISI